jgi:hypothetical protein
VSIARFCFQQVPFNDTQVWYDKTNHFFRNCNTSYNQTKAPAKQEFSTVLSVAANLLGINSKARRPGSFSLSYQAALKLPSGAGKSQDQP